MTPRPQKAVWIWLASLLLPGAGHVLLGMMAAGAVVALLWGLVSGAALVLSILRSGSRTPAWAAALCALAVAMYVAAQISLYLRLRSVKRLRSDTRRDERFKAALVAYLQGRLDEAESICRSLLREDADDVEAMLQLGSVARRRGDVAAARAYLARARYLDDEGRWDSPIGRELVGLGRAATPSPK